MSQPTDPSVVIDLLIEAARVLGATQAKKLYGDYTPVDARVERAMREVIAKHIATIMELAASK